MIIKNPQDENECFKTKANVLEIEIMDFEI